MSQEFTLGSVERCAMGTAIKTVLETIFYALPGIVAFLMAALALAVIYMDELQTKLKDQRLIRWIVAIVLIAMGVAAFVSDRVQKREEQRNTSEMVTRTAVDTATNLAPKIAADTASHVTEKLNKDYGAVMSGLYSEIASLQAQQKNQNGLTKQQMALTYTPSADLVYAGDQCLMVVEFVSLPQMVKSKPLRSRSQFLLEFR
jgi:type IV secretory pathway VirB2 component (pilin)